MFTRGQLFSLVYHDIFKYPLTEQELKKWVAVKEFSIINSQLSINQKNGFYFLAGHSRFVAKRLARERFSFKKLTIAKKAARVLSFIPTVKMVGVTGSLAMANAGQGGDIDLLVVTKKGNLWTTRLIAVLALLLVGIPVRKVGSSGQKDKICINIWLDETALSWSKKSRNIYTAHEISQIIPLVNKEKIYEKFLWENKWILKYWPKAAKIPSAKDIKILSKEENKKHSISRYLNILISLLIEPIAFKLQYFYMKPRITRETITPTRALFHPVDWGKIVLKKLRS